MTFRLNYDPTPRELMKADRLVEKSVFSGVWSSIKTLRDCVLFLGLITAAFSTAIALILVFVSSPFSFNEAGPLYYGLSLAVLAGFHGIGWQFQKRRAKYAQLSPFLQGQVVTVSEDGIRFENERSHGMIGWPDINDIAEARKMSVAICAGGGLALSDRILAHAGEPAEMRAQMRQWHQAAQASK